MIVLDDFVMLGKGVPEPSYDYYEGIPEEVRAGRICVCSAGVSDSLGLVRINPIALRNSPPRWSVNSIVLDKNPKDTRIESYKIADNRTPFHLINNNFHKVRNKFPESKRLELLEKYFVPSIDAANDKKLSLALMDIYESELYFRENDEFSPEVYLFSQNPLDYKTKVRFRYHPRLKFRDEDGKKHDLRIRDWGAFEWMRKWDDKRNDELLYTLHLDKPRVLLVGNMVKYRNAWLIISVLSTL